MLNIKAEHFIEDINQTLNASLSSFDFTIDDQLKQFIHSFTSVVNKHAPHKIATRKERKLKTKQWLSSSLSARLKPKMRCKNRFVKQEEAKFKNYKTYSNVLNQTIEIAKQKSIL